jgi:RNA polymerase sigma-70 factor (ECF subfamily)
MSDDTVARLVDEFRRGDQQAASALFHRFASQLTVVASKQLSPSVAVRVDGEDIVQSVFRSFFTRCSSGRFQIDDAEQLWRLLLTITLRKARSQARLHRAQRRSVESAAPIQESDWLAEDLARQPSAEDALILTDELHQVLKDLPPTYGRMLEMRLAEHSVEEIADELGISQHSVRRALKLLRDKLLRRMSP